jgi:protein-L-isoaspartate(D-aspartate) O-methyltransferase
MSLGTKVGRRKRSERRRSSRSLWSLAGAILLSLTQACNGSNGSADGPTQDPRDRDFAYERERMVELQLESRGIHDERVLDAMRKVLRHRFAPDLDPANAYDDRPYPIGNAQTISQPYIVALMSELAQVRPPCKVLEVGTGSGYQAAVLAEMGCTVYTIEIIESLADRARKILGAEGYGERVHGRFGDGYRGWPEEAPFDAVVVTAAAPRVPEPLLEQLRVGGRLVIPVGNLWQSLEVHLRTDEGFERDRISDVRFVPMMGEIRD